MSTRHTALLELIYDAAVSPELWNDVLIGVSDHVRAGPINLAGLDIKSGRGTVMFARADPASLDEYWEYYASINPLVIVDDPETYCENWQLEVRTDDEMIDRSVFSRTEYYNDMLLARGVERLVSVRLSLQGTRVATLTMGRGPGRGGFSPAEVEALRFLQPHLVRSLRLAERLAAVSFQPDALLNTDALARDAIMLVDASGVILFKNSTAETLLGKTGCLRARHGLICAVRADEDAKLQKLIGMATSDRAEHKSGGSVLMMQPGGEPLTVVVSPLTSAVASMFAGPAVALVLVKTPEPARQLVAALLKQHLRLTESEVRLSRSLFEGATLADAASRLGVSRHTVRAQLGAIFAKTGTHRQAELVRALAQFSVAPSE